MKGEEQNIKVKKYKRLFFIGFGLYVLQWVLSLWFSKIMFNIILSAQGLYPTQAITSFLKEYKLSLVALGLDHNFFYSMIANSIYPLSILGIIGFIMIVVYGIAWYLGKRGDYKYKCDICNKKFKSLKEAKQHEKVCKK